MRFCCSHKDKQACAHTLSVSTQFCSRLIGDMCMPTQTRAHWQELRGDDDYHAFERFEATRWPFGREMPDPVQCEICEKSAQDASCLRGSCCLSVVSAQSQSVFVSLSVFHTVVQQYCKVVYWCRARALDRTKMKLSRAATSHGAATSSARRAYWRSPGHAATIAT